jgi:hypothetical protein
LKGKIGNSMGEKKTWRAGREIFLKKRGGL